MITQFKFVIEDALKRKWYYLKFVIQFIVALILIGFCASQLFHLNNYKNKFEIYNNTSQMYLINDNTDGDKFEQIYNDKNSQKKAFEFYNYLTNSDKFKIYTYNETYLDIARNKHLKYEELSEDYKAFPAILIDRGFVDIFNLSAVKGRLFNKKDYTTAKSKYTPVILGWNYKKVYKPGDIINQKYKVVGILEKDLFYLQPMRMGEIYPLNDEVILPLVINEKTDFSGLDGAITRATILTNDKSCLDRISQKSKDLGLYDLGFTSYSKQLENIIEECILSLSIPITVSALILFFCIMCIISSLLNYIETHKREFAIHMLCGATKMDFIIRFIMQIILQLIIGCVAGICIFKNTNISLVIIATALAILLITTALPILTIRRMTTSELLKRSE